MGVGAACRSVIVHATSTGTLKRWTRVRADASGSASVEQFVVGGQKLKRIVALLSTTTQDHVRCAHPALSPGICRWSPY